MGILAIVDTFLVFKIGERWHGRSVGFISSTLFAVMPVTWFLRMIVLENIMLPFLLSSILLITYITRTKKNSTVRDAGAYEMNRRNLLVFLLSGVLFGLAAFTKEFSCHSDSICGFFGIYQTKSSSGTEDSKM